MERFSRQWTIDLSISSEEFHNYFYQVARKKEWALEKPFVLANNFQKDFFGTIRQQSFSMWKRTGLLDFKGVTELYGKIIDKGSSIQLELKMINNFRFNYFSILFSDIIFGFVLLLIFNAIMGITGIGSALIGNHSVTSTYLIIAGSIMCGIAHYIQIKLIDRHLDNLENLYSLALLEMEATAKTKKFNS